MRRSPANPNPDLDLLNPKLIDFNSVEDYYCSAKFQVIPIRGFRFIVLAHPHSSLSTKSTQYRRICRSLRTTSSALSHSDTFSSNFFSKPLGILDTEGIKKINNNNNNNNHCKSSYCSHWLLLVQFPLHSFIHYAMLWSNLSEFRHFH